MGLVETEFSGGVLTVTLADEKRRNTLGHQLVAELSATLDVADRDPTVRVVVLTNRGSVFCAGANLAERSEEASEGASVERVNPMAIFGRFRHSPKPYVGRIAGHCVAGGMGLAAALDITVAQESATFGFTEVRIGVAPAMISVVCLPKMRLADAQAAFLRGNRFPATEAARIGLITTAVPDDQLDDEVQAIVADLLAGAASAIAAAKQVTVTVPTMSEDDAFAWTADLSARMFAGDDAREGMTAFLEKRAPTWAQ